MKYTSKAKKTEQDDLSSVIKKEVKVPYLREVFIYDFNMPKHEIKGLRKNELIALFSDKVTSVLASDSTDSNKG